MNKKQQNIYTICKELADNNESVTLDINLFSGDGSQIELTLNRTFEDKIDKTLYIYIENDSFFLTHEKEYIGLKRKDGIKIKGDLSKIKTLEINKHNLTVTINGFEVSY